MAYQLPSAALRAAAISAAILWSPGQLCGAPPMAGTAAGETPLITAILQRDIETSRALVRRGIGIHDVDDRGRTALHYAALGGHAELAERLIAQGTPVDARDIRGETALHLAGRRLRLAMVESLIRGGADLNARNEFGQTALHLIADQGPDEVELDVRATAIAGELIARGADATLFDQSGRRAVDNAALHQHQNLTTLLTANSGAPMPFPAAPAGEFPGYPTWAEIESALLTAELNYPAICTRVFIGTTVQGRSIWAAHITDNVGTDEDEPEVKYISTMHGDEILGVEMCLRLIDELTDGYGNDPRLTTIVDEIDLWIIPCMNPDGYVSGSRNNANGQNLNRDFPDPFTSPSNSTAGRQPETASIMTWTWANSFTLSANFHGGAMVVNYPYDNNPSGSSVYTACPDDDLFIWISEAYSFFNGPMWNSASFFHGITNGADWYSIAGGMQDWSYRYEGTNEVTIELADNKQPPASQVPMYWSDNRDALLSYIETALIGVRGVVTDATDGSPIDATITVIDRDHAIFTDVDLGDYHRMLLPGLYDLRFTAEGYDPVLVSGVEVFPGDATRLDVEMAGPARVVTPNGGEELAVGAAALIEWTGQSAAQFNVQCTTNYGTSNEIADGFESGGFDPAYSTGGSANWIITTNNPYSGARSAQSGDVADDQSSWLERTVGGGTLGFWYQVSSESGWDFFNFSIDGEQRVHASGTSGGWIWFSDTLAPGDHLLRWEYVKDGSVTNGSDTVWIDDLELVEDGTLWTDIVALTEVGALSTAWTPTEESSTAKVRVRAYYDVSGYGDWDESDELFSIVAGLCPADVDGSGDVGFSDLVAVLAAWGDCAACPPDVDGDGSVGFSDLVLVLAAWGDCV